MITLFNKVSPASRRVSQIPSPGSQRDLWSTAVRQHVLSVSAQIKATGRLFSTTRWDGRAATLSHCWSFNSGLIRMLGLQRKTGYQMNEWHAKEGGVITVIKGLIGQAGTFLCWLSGNRRDWGEQSGEELTQRSNQTVCAIHRRAFSTLNGRKLSQQSSI